MPGVVSYAEQATDEQVTHLRIYADAKGETHMQESISRCSQKRSSGAIFRYTSRISAVGAGRLIAARFNDGATQIVQLDIEEDD